MKIEFSVFFDILDLDNFYENLFFISDNQRYKYQLIEKKDMHDTSIKKNLLEYEGYTYMQKDSLVIYRNTDFDGWINRVRLTAIKNNLKAVKIFIDNESEYPAYMMHYYQNGEERIIYSLKDSKWVFFEKGLQQPFEEDDKYNEKGATKKFNFQKIMKFCKNLGINLDDSEFFIPVSKIYYDYRI